MAASASLCPAKFVPTTHARWWISQKKCSGASVQFQLPKKFFWCRGCHLGHICSRESQREHWSQHKKPARISLSIDWSRSRSHAWDCQDWYLSRQPNLLFFLSLFGKGCPEWRCGRLSPSSWPGFARVSGWSSSSFINIDSIKERRRSPLSMKLWSYSTRAVFRC